MLLTYLLSWSYFSIWSHFSVHGCGVNFIDLVWQLINNLTNKNDERMISPVVTQSGANHSLSAVVTCNQTVVISPGLSCDFVLYPRSCHPSLNINLLRFPNKHNCCHSNITPHFKGCFVKLNSVTNWTKLHCGACRRVPFVETNQTKAVHISELTSAHILGSNAPTGAKALDTKQ